MQQQWPHHVRLSCLVLTGGGGIGGTGRGGTEQAGHAHEYYSSQSTCVLAVLAVHGACAFSTLTGPTSSTDDFGRRGCTLAVHLYSTLMPA